MKEVYAYKDIVDLTIQLLQVFSKTNYDDESQALTYYDDFKKNCIASNWSPETIMKYRYRIEQFDPEDLKKEILRDYPDSQELKRRLELVKHELSLKPLEGDSYLQLYDEECFKLPCEDDLQRNKEIIESLSSIHSEEWAFNVMLQMRLTVEAMNARTKRVKGIIEELTELIDPERREDYPKEITQLFNSPEDCYSFFKDGDGLKCAGWARRLYEYEIQGRFIYTIHGDYKTIYDQIKKLHPRIVSIDTFHETLRNLRNK